MKATFLGWLVRAALAATVALMASPAAASEIDFEDVFPGGTGPSRLSQIDPFQPDQGAFHAGGLDVAVDGGVFLIKALDVPANQSTIYLTACHGECTTIPPVLSNPLTITFSEPINNFFVDVYNTWLVDVLYRVYDNNGNSAVFLLPPGPASGQKQIGFAATGTIVSIEAFPVGAEGLYDFSIDNIHFDEALPPLDPVPEPGSMLLLGSGLAGAIAARRRRRNAA